MNGVWRGGGTPAILEGGGGDLDIVAPSRTSRIGAA